MKLIVLQEDLFKALSIVTRFASARSQLPVLSNILLGADSSKLNLAATNLEMGISLSLAAKVESPGALTVPAKIFLDLISNLTTGKLSLSIYRDKLIIESGSFKAELAGIPASEFPSVPDKLPDEKFTLPLSVLTQITDQVAFAGSVDETRPQLTGVLLLLDEKLKAVATDGFRLSVKEFDYKTNESKRFLVPVRALDELVKINKAGDENIEVAILEKEGQMIFGSENIVLTGRLLEGEFPDFNRILPNTYNFQAKTGKDEFYRAIKSASVFARDSASVIKLTIDKDQVKVSAENIQYGKNEATLEAVTIGQNLSVAFNYRYVLDFIASMKGDEVVFQTEAADKPGVFKDSSDESYTHLIMPVRLPSQ